MSSSMEPKEFIEVLDEELDEIHKSRVLREASCDDLKLSPVSDSPDPYQRAADSELLGLAFSGGGIRSATFNLGVLQGLARFRILPRIDYLSTVSGGGYIGSWLTTWIKRRGLNFVEKSLKQMAVLGKNFEPEEIKFLRKYSNYLYPRLGMLNADSLITTVLYVSHLFWNLAILAAILGQIIIIIKILNVLSSVVGSLPFHAILVAIGLILCLPTYFINLNLGRLEEVDKWYLRQGAIQLTIVLPTLIAAWLMAISLDAHIDKLRDLQWVPIVALGITGFNAVLWIISRRGFRVIWYRLFYLFLSVFFCCTLIWSLTLFYSNLSDAARSVLGVPLLLVIMNLGAFMYFRFVGKGLATSSREWWSQTSAWIVIFGLAYMVVFAITIYGPIWWVNVASWMREVLTSGWILTIIAGLLSNIIAGKSTKETALGLSKLIKIAPIIFTIGFIIFFPLCWLPVLSPQLRPWGSR